MEIAMKRSICALLILLATTAFAADVKITELTDYSPARTTDPLVIVDVTTDTTKKISVVNLTGKIPVAAKSSAYTLGSDTGKDMESYGGIVVLTGAAVVTLPSASVGMSACVYANTTSKVSVKAGSSDHWIMSDGTALDNGDKISQTGTGGFVCFGVLEANHWFIFGSRGTWADDGA